jgi:asparagine synthase (glutamine-hydrolysing)
MCGITGYWAPPNSSIAPTMLERMNRSLTRRGPDGQGHYEQEGIGLAMRRLAIIDLEGGWQPIYNEDRSVVVVMNGEIYNYQKLSRRLVAQGHRFYTRSDTEVLVHLYEEHGDALVEHLEGMFAFALWDARRRRLLIARDRLGIKPLFYGWADDKLFFGSEIKALKASDAFPLEIDPVALDQFFTFNFIPAPRSIYRSIRKLMPGHRLIIEADGTQRVEPYWALPRPPQQALPIEDGTLAIVERTLVDAIESHLIADVPVGSFLSGGVDSGLVTAIASKLLGGKALSTYTIGFASSGKAFLDERGFARELAQRYHCEHHEFEVRADVAEIFPEIVQAFDEPFADDSVIPTYYVCHLAGKDLKVALTGLGGDELFGGYRRHAGIRLEDRLGVAGSALRACLAAPVRLIPESFARSDAIDHVKRFARSGGSRAERYAQFMSALPVMERHRLYSDRLRGELVSCLDAENPVCARFSELPLGSALRRALHADAAVYLPDDVLTLTDRLSMWHSLELRVPFLDRALVELAAKLPDSLCIRGSQQKVILRRIAERWLPASILNHRKQGFEAPMGSWLRGPLLGFFDAKVNEQAVRDCGILNWPAIKALRDAHVSGRHKHSKALFAALMLTGWCESYSS